MSPQLVLWMLFGLATMAMDAILWGVTGYVFFRLAGGRDEQWWIGAALVAAVYFLWADIAVGRLMQTVGVSIQNESISGFLGPDLWSIDPFDVILSVVPSVVGFRVGRALFLRAVPHTRQHGPAVV